MKKKNILIAVLILVIVILVSYICYDKFYLDKRLLNDNDDIVANGNVDTNNISSYKILKEDFLNKYLVNVSGNNYEVLYSFNEDIHIIGIYNDKFYFSDYEGIKYINLNDKEFKETKWVDFWKVDSNCVKCGGYNIVNSIIVNEVLYFTVSPSAGGGNFTDGILSLDMNSTSIEEFVQVIPEADWNWKINEEKTKIYYAKRMIVSGGWYDEVLYSYDIINKIDTRLTDDESIEEYFYDNNKVIYRVLNDSDLFIYDVNNSKKEIIDNNLPRFGNHTFAVNNGIVYYYKMGGKVYSYNFINDKKTILYEMENELVFDSLYYINNDIVSIYCDTELISPPCKYLKNGKQIDKLEEVDVKMLNGSNKKFEIIDFVEINN